MAITPLPTPPTRSDAVNFASRGDEFMAAMPTFVTEANATAAAMDAALQTSMLGVTATSSTSLAIGTGSKSLTVETGKGFVVGMSLKIASTANPTNYMIGTVTSYTSGTLVVDVDTVGGSGTVAAWSVSIATMGDIDVAGGASETTSAIDITLTASSPRVQVINMTATGKIVILPDATTMSEGGLAYIFRAAGYSYMVLSSTGKFVGTAESGKVLHVCLVDNSTAAGTWSGQLVADNNPGFGIGLSSVFESASSDYAIPVWIDDNRCLVIYKDGGNSNYLTGCILTKSGPVFTPGTPFVIATSAWSYATPVLADTNTVVIVGYNGTYGAAIAFTISGATVVTIGTQVALSSTTSGDGQQPGACLLESNKVFACFRQLTTGYLQGAVLTISGTTITANAPVTANAEASYWLCPRLLDTNKIFLAFSSGTAAKGFICTISGTTPSFGTVATIAANGAHTKAAILNPTTAVVIFNNTSNSYPQHVVCTISGTTITPGTAASYLSAANYYPHGIVKLSSASVLAAYQNPGSPATYSLDILTVSGTTITAATVGSTFSGTLSGYAGAGSMDIYDGSIAIGYHAVTTYYGTALLLVG